MNLILNKDGSIEFLDGPPSIQLHSFQVDPNNPRRFIPKFPDCVKRENLSRLSPCKQRAIFLWHCWKFGKSVSVSDCEKCDAREPQSGLSTTVVRNLSVCSDNNK